MLACYAVATPRPAYALFGVGDIISDPLAQAKNVEKVAQMILQLEQMATQLRQLQAQIESLGSLLNNPGDGAFERAGQAMNALTRMQQTLDHWQTDLPTDLDPQTVTIDQLAPRMAKVRAYLQDRLTEVEASLAAVEANREQVTTQVAATVRASNAAQGPKAAQQAANQLQAILSAEQSKLQALRAMRTRLRVDADAAGQAEEAAAESVRQREMEGMRKSIETIRQEGQGGTTGGN